MTDSCGAVYLDVKGLKGTKKCCDKCGKLINIKRIHIIWFPEDHSFSWICGECKRKITEQPEWWLV